MNINSAAILIFNWEKKPVPARKNRGGVYFAQHCRKHLLALQDEWRKLVSSTTVAIGTGKISAGTATAGRLHG